MSYSFSSLKQKVSEIEDWLKKEFSSIRTSRATPIILDSVWVEVYGSRLQINQLATVNIEDPKTLRITPWDKSQIKLIETAIRDSALGVSVVVDDKGLRVIFPQLTEESRNTFIKFAKQKHEEARKNLRLERDKVKGDIENKEKKGEMAEDDKFRDLEELQKNTDEANNKFDEMLERKEHEILGN